MIFPSRVRITCPTLPVEAETITSLPSSEIAMWSARWPATGVRQAISSVFRLIATTSAKLGRET